MGPTGFIALVGGWITTEAGRQPWVVYGVLRTVDAASPNNAQAVGISLMIFMFTYFLVFGTGIYYILKLIRTGPSLPMSSDKSKSHQWGDDGHGDRNQTARRPLSGSNVPIDSH